MVVMYDSIRDVMDSLGYANMSFGINVLNDENLENVLFSYYRGIIVYDVMAQ